MEKKRKVRWTLGICRVNRVSQFGSFLKYEDPNKEHQILPIATDPQNGTPDFGSLPNVSGM